MDRISAYRTLIKHMSPENLVQLVNRIMNHPDATLQRLFDEDNDKERP